MATEPILRCLFLRPFSPPVVGISMFLPRVAPLHAVVRHLFIIVIYEASLEVM